MKKLVSLLVVLVLIIAAPVPAAYASGGEAKAEGHGEAKKGEEGGEKKETKPKDVTGGRFEGDPVFVRLEPFILPVISEQGAEQIITLRIDLEVKDLEVADSIHSSMPRVRDAIMRALYGGLGQGSLRNGKLVDVNKVKSKSLKAIEEVIPAGGIRNVLIQGVAQRML